MASLLMRRVIALLPLAVLAALAVLFFGYGLHRQTEIMPSAMVGKTMPDMPRARLEDNAPMTLSEAVAEAGLGADNGRLPVLINFYASWCPPCVAENPELMKLKAQGVKIVGIALKDEPANTSTFLNSHGDPFAIHLLDPDGRLGVEFGVQGPPETFVIGVDGRIRGKHASAITTQEALAMLAKARS
ncbi:MAG: thiol:disulfide interchange protein [Caulobacteraceae bacterium]|nr:thiol:disulfide interchange protein [Caulobacteraceae bacterium]